MKVKIAAVIILIIITLSVFLNTVILDRQLTELTETAGKLDEESISLHKIDALFTLFKKKEPFMSLTVSHDDLTKIGECIIEMKSYYSQDDYANVMVAKNRLEYFLKHLRRLSGFNINSII